ncbi:MAG: hypothetical protein PHF46_05225 [Candidatus Gracilibacteria bacterium]|nr:hypothetical protein [Candidatus Gracilibacteria bacterium]
MKQEQRLALNYDYYLSRFGKANLDSALVYEEIRQELIKEIETTYGSKVQEQVLEDASKGGFSVHPLWFFEKYCKRRFELFILNLAGYNIKRLVEYLRKSRHPKYATYISSLQEIETIKKEQEDLEKRLKEYLYIQIINKNGLDVKIYKETRITRYRYKDGIEYEINGNVFFPEKLKSDKIKQIILECAEAGLHSKRIGMLLWTVQRRIKYMASKIGAKVSITAKTEIRKFPTIRVLDKDGMFIIEKPNPYFKKIEDKEQQ